MTDDEITRGFETFEYFAGVEAKIEDDFALRAMAHPEIDELAQSFSNALTGSLLNTLATRQDEQLSREAEALRGQFEKGFYRIGFTFTDIEGEALDTVSPTAILMALCSIIEAAEGDMYTVAHELTVLATMMESYEQDYPAFKNATPDVRFGYLFAKVQEHGSGTGVFRGDDSL